MSIQPSVEFRFYSGIATHTFNNWSPRFLHLRPVRPEDEKRWFVECVEPWERAMTVEPAIAPK